MPPSRPRADNSQHLVNLTLSMVAFRQNDTMQMIVRAPGFAAPGTVTHFMPDFRDTRPARISRLEMPFAR